MKNCAIGFLVGLCLMLLLGATHMRYVDGHCQSSLSDVGLDGKVYLAVTNTTTGKTVVHRFGPEDFEYRNEAVFDATLINKDVETARTRR